MTTPPAPVQVPPPPSAKDRVMFAPVAAVRRSLQNRREATVDLTDPLCSQCTQPAPSETAARTVTLVHGTFANHADWMQSGSELVDSLEEDGALIYRFCWSGRNRQADRVRAAGQLRAHLTSLVDRSPDADHLVIAHSHGGNVALYALQQPDGGGVIEQLAKVRVACLATPFIAIRRHMSRRILLLGVVLSFFVTIGIADTTDSVLGWVWVAAVATAMTLFVVSAILHAVLNRLPDHGNALSKKHSRRARDSYTARVSPETDALILRSVGDEASMLLTTSQLFGWAIFRLMSPFAGLLAPLRSARTIAGDLGAVPGRSRVKQVPHQLRQLGQIAVRLTAGTALLLYGLLLWLLVVMYLTPVTVFGAAPFGLDMACWSLSGHVTAESTPLGHARTYTAVEELKSELAHGVYDDPPIMAAITEWSRQAPIGVPVAAI